MSGFKLVRAADFMNFNPRERLPKNTMAKKVAMERLQPFTRDILGFEVSPFNGGSKFRNGDTLMARITPCLENGKTAQINILNDGEVGFGSTEFIVLRAKPGVSDKDFVYYLAMSPLLRDTAIKSMVGSSGRQRVQQGVLDNMEFYAPSLSDQVEIGRTLSVLDDKIANNSKINHHLAQMAQAVFKSWFVDFEPSGGKKPPDWREDELGNVTTLNAGGDKPIIFSPTPTVECSIPVYSNGIDNLGLYGYTDYPKVTEESVTVSARGTIGFVCLRQDPFVPIVRLVTVIPNKSFITAKYLYLYLRSIHIAGVGTTQQQLTVPDFKKYRILVPNRTVVKDFTQTVDPMFETIRQNLEENARLAAIRDALLPRLMSGDLSIADIYAAK